MPNPSTFPVKGLSFEIDDGHVNTTQHDLLRQDIDHIYTTDTNVKCT